MKKRKKFELSEAPKYSQSVGPNPRQLADLYGNSILSLMPDKTECYAVRLFQELREVFDEFPDDVLKFYSVMQLLKQWKWIDSRDECEMTSWPGQQQQVRIRRTLYWKL